MSGVMTGWFVLALGALSLSACGKTNANDQGGPSPGGGVGASAMGATAGVPAVDAGAGGTPSQAGAPDGAVGGEAGACAGESCCAVACDVCEQCSGLGGSCEPVPLRQEDKEPEDACSGENWCDGRGRCERKAQVVAGYQETCARSNDGAVTCWGGRYLTKDTFDVIGDDETPASVGPLNLAGEVVQLAGGRLFICALFSEGNVRCWGNDGGTGRLGYGGGQSDLGFLDAPDLDLGGKAIQVTAGREHACVLLIGGNVRCWGDSNDQTPAEAGDVAIAGLVVGVNAGQHHSCAVLSDRNATCWGLPPWASPAQVQAVQANAVEVAGGQLHTCALLADASVRCWGQHDFGALGSGASTSVLDATDLPSVKVGGPVKRIVAGERHTCALLEGGKVRCWGLGQDGQLGYGNTDNIGDNETPESAGDVDVGGEVLELAAGSAHTCALLAGDAIRCWGNNQAGQLGYGHTEAIGDNETPASAGDVPYR